MDASEKDKWMTMMGRRLAFYCLSLYTISLCHLNFHHVPVLSVIFCSYIVFIVFKVVLKNLFIYFYREGKGGKRGRETSMCGCLSHASSGDLVPTQACELTAN